MDSDLKVAVAEERGELTVVAMTGELDITTAAEAYVSTTALLVGRPDLIVDLSGVTFCDSSGFNALLRLRRRVVEAGGWLALAASPKPIGSLLTLTGTDTVFAVYRNVAEAVTDYERPEGRQ
ncbi:STAS domain-containing protein [Streptomyces sp. NBC_01198]|uniref:STAS domain-containing protein n=1 Tax=Streptomyces sp. NBC_01198 TaxID=2903769 RepID=UPI002E0EB2CF|nr:STAS domain-containing protein [Streptomyces sp. NBC_01198]